MARSGSLLVLASTLLAACITTRQVARPATVEQLQQQIAADSVSIGSRDPNAHDPVTLLYEPAGAGPGAAARLPPSAGAAVSAGGVVAAGADLTLIRGYQVKRRIPA